MEWLGLAGAILGAGGLAALLRMRGEREKLLAEAAKIREEAEAYATKADFERLRGIIDTLATRIREQDQKIALQAVRITELEAENMRLCQILRRAGINPNCAEG